MVASVKINGTWELYVPFCCDGDLRRFKMTAAFDYCNLFL